ncbi:MAG TPA: RNA polymerase sigma factor [Candidatus Paceibacterota bacterium]|nr:RNA polymerase sigma factor [Candidatus Paceibacterota bacterium]
MSTIPPETIERARKGDILAFEEIVSTFEKPLWSYLVRLVGSRDDAEDLIQDTFVKVFKNIKTVDPSKNIKSWIYTIATNTAYDFLRKKKRQPTVELDEEYETKPDNASYYSVSTEDSVETKDVAAAITRLDLLYRGPIILYYKDGFSYEEIASMLSIPINTLKTRLSRAKKQLASLLVNYE